MKTRMIDRRTILRGIGGIALALPFLDVMRDEAIAAPTAPPKRFLAMFSPNGTIASSWDPTGTETKFTLPDILSPLAPHQSDVIVLQGVEMKSTRKGPGSAHMKGVGHLLTGRPLLDGNFTGGGGATSGWGSGISVDQEMAKSDAIVGKTPYRSLELGVRTGGADVRSRIAYRGSADPLPPQTNPAKLFEALFAASTLDPTALANLKADKKSVLDFVQEDFSRLNQYVGAEDKQRLDGHLATMREIEKRVDDLGKQQCTAPVLPAMPPALDDAHIPQISQLQIDILVAALACDLTRIATFMWSNGSCGTTFPFLKISQGHHSLSHEPDSDAAAQAKLVQINKFYASQFAYLLARMKSVTEANGTLLDNSLILWGNELGKGNSHSRSNIPFILAGSAGGYFKTGRYLKYTNAPPHNNLLVSMLNAMGSPATTFGDPEFCTGPLANLHA